MPESADYERGVAAGLLANDRFAELIKQKRPIERAIVRLAAEQGLCPKCKEIILRFSTHD